MNIALWVVQILLALVFLMVGTLKVTQPKEKMAKNMEWVKVTPTWAIRLLGILEILGAIGLILPIVTGILPWLTALAAVGLVLVMVGAIILHGRQREFPQLGGTVVILLLALFVVYGRF